MSLTGKTAADAFGQLSYSQILPLLGMAEEEREELAEENDLPSMSSREIAALVKERDEAKEAAEKATAEKAAAELKFEGAAKARETVLHELKLAQYECDVVKQTAADLQEQLERYRGQACGSA